MVDYINDYLGPKFEEKHPGVTVRAVGTGPGDAGSQMIYERLAAAAGRRRAEADFDVGVVHQKMAGQMVEEELLASYRDEIATGDLVTRDTAENSLGTNVSGYVMPMFHSQTAIAYNPALVPDPPETYDELVAMGEGKSRPVWLQRHQGRHVGRELRDGLDVCLHR